MKILWLVNTSLPEVSVLMGEEPSPYGGWLINASEDLSKKANVELSIAFPKKNINSYRLIKGENINYYPFKPIKDYNIGKINKNEIFKEIIKKVRPNIVHIYGTEMPHTLSMMNILEKQQTKSVISIQGLLSKYSKHIFANLPFKVVYGFAFGDIIKKYNVWGRKKLFEKRGENEIKSLKKTDNIIGRTTWDKSCALQINSEAKYHHCNETLRKEFYETEWDIDNCERHSIFLSQASSPRKGLHYVLKALKIVNDNYPDVKLYVAGENIIKSKTFKDKIFMTYYSKYIKNLIKNYNLQNNIIFTGPLNAEEMVKMYLKSHISICPSSIENSPNSLGEAMILGVPTVASYVGGIPDMLEDKEDGFLYQADAPYMLAYYIKQIFSDDDLATEISGSARKKALKTHNRDKNTKKLLEIYNEIINN